MSRHRANKIDSVADGLVQRSEPRRAGAPPTGLTPTPPLVDHRRAAAAAAETLSAACWKTGGEIRVRSIIITYIQWIFVRIFEAIIEMVRCQCNGDCSSARCSSRSKDLSCTDLSSICIALIVKMMKILRNIILLNDSDDNWTNSYFTPVWH